MPTTDDTFWLKNGSQRVRVRFKKSVANCYEFRSIHVVRELFQEKNIILTFMTINYLNNKDHSVAPLIRSHVN